MFKMRSDHTQNIISSILLIVQTVKRWGSKKMNYTENYNFVLFFGLILKKLNAVEENDVTD